MSNIWKSGFVLVIVWSSIATLLFLWRLHVPLTFVWKTVQALNDGGRYQQTKFYGRSKATLVLILTYMRSGSSLTGDILQHSPEAFYVYEPLRSIQYISERNVTMEYINGTKRYPPVRVIDEAADVFQNWFTCNIPSLPMVSLQDKAFLGYGLKSRLYNTCMGKKDNRRTGENRDCVNMIKQLCEDSPIRIVKTIRVQFGTIKHLLDTLPTLKIIHLVRDPRSTLLSQSKMGICSKKHGGFRNCINNNCMRLENNIIDEEILNQKYPYRIMTAFYEHIARHPFDAAKEMYDFCGTDFTENAHQYIYNITMAGNPDNCAICTVRSNSSEHIDIWKRSMSTTFLNMIQERCNYILKRYQYGIYHEKTYKGNKVFDTLEFDKL